MPQNVKDNVLVADPKTLAERNKVAKDFVKDFKVSLPVLVDSIDDAVGKAYSGWPDRLYVIDAAGKIAYVGGPGPGGFKPAEVPPVLVGGAFPYSARRAIAYGDGWLPSGELTEAVPRFRQMAAEAGRDLDKMLQQSYRGSRYSFGYPACPRLEDQEPILKLLGAERIGVSLSDEFQLHPEQSTSAIVVLNPRAKYFSV